ncbi:rod shape-determining protein MreC [Helicobacter cetorum]|uniref:rod shape-determining protein MreC n=1 Tax=Helicobacter cetorum TaxID=138563 RepID=UPI000CF06638|nr:rod shape-determining protein MreC [Helicobacter cetorum]
MRFYAKLIGFLGIFFLFYFLDIKGSSSYVSDALKGVLVGTKNAISSGFQAYFFQAKSIKEFQKEHLEFEALKLENADLKERLKAFDSSYENSLSVHYFPIFMTSFASFENTNSIYLSHSLSLEEDKIYGLVSHKQAIGIALLEQGRLKGYLNAHKRCAYSVVVGENEVLGFTKANAKQELVVEFIAPSASIKVGDKVMTSGLDGIFGAGVYVGEVAKIEEHYTYKSAVLKNAFISSATFLRHVFLSMP